MASSANTVFATYELAEQIFLDVRAFAYYDTSWYDHVKAVKDVVLLRGTNRACKQVIDSSTKLQPRLYIQPWATVPTIYGAHLPLNPLIRFGTLCIDRAKIYFHARMIDCTKKGLKIHLDYEIREPISESEFAACFSSRYALWRKMLLSNEKCQVNINIVVGGSEDKPTHLKVKCHKHARLSYFVDAIAYHYNMLREQTDCLPAGDELRENEV